MRVTNSFKKISKLTHRIKCIQGSQGASKTYSILQRWIIQAIHSDRYQLCSIVTDTFPNLRSGAIKDFESICDINKINYSKTKTPMVFKINKWTFEFFSVDKETKGLGGRRDRLFINECNRMPWDTSRQLIARTHEEAILDYNPSRKFWVHEQYVETGDCDFLKLTYKDNEYLPDAELESIERHAPWGSSPDDSYWRVYGLGEVGFVKGAVFKDFNSYKEIPKECKVERILGLDFGWVHALGCILVSLDKKNRRIYWEEIYYAQETDYDELAKVIKSHPRAKGLSVICDSAAPRDIYDLRKRGLKALGADKKGGVSSDIRRIKQYSLFVHENSKNLRRELELYQWQIINGEVLDVPVKKHDDAIDAARYGSIVLLNFQ